MVSHALSPVVLILKAYILETTRTSHIQLEFSDWKYDIVCIWYNDNFIAREEKYIKLCLFTLSRILQCIIGAIIL